MAEPPNETTLFSQPQARIDWSIGEQQFERTNRVLGLVTELTKELHKARDAYQLDPIMEDEEVSRSEERRVGKEC